MRIESGWCFDIADFSMQASGKSTLGVVMLVRDQETRKKWHNLSDELKESEEGPELYVSGKGKTLEEAVAVANLAAAQTKDI